MLHQKRVVEEAVWSIRRSRSFAPKTGIRGWPYLFDLVKTFQGVLDRIKTRPTYEIDKEEVSVPDMIRYLHHVFEDTRGKKSVSARELLERQKSRRAMICLFLAMLELVKIQAIGLVQQEGFGEIGLKRLKGFETAFTSTEDMAAIDEGYN